MLFDDLDLLHREGVGCPFCPKLSKKQKRTGTKNKTDVGHGQNRQNGHRQKGQNRHGQNGHGKKGKNGQKYYIHNCLLKVYFKLIFSESSSLAVGHHVASSKKVRSGSL